MLLLSWLAGAQEIEDRKRIHQLISRDPASGSSMHPPDSLHSYSTDVLLLKVESLQAQLNEQVICSSWDLILPHPSTQDDASLLACVKSLTWPWSQFPVRIVSN